MKFREKLIIIIPAVLIVLTVIGLLFFFNHETEYTLNEEAFQTFAGAVSEIPAGTKMKVSDDGKSMTAAKDDLWVDISDVPIYFPNQEKVMEPFETIYYQPRANAYEKAGFFMEYLITDGGALHARSGKKEINLFGGFGFDGKDTYLFLEDMKLSVNNHTYEVPRFSYVYALYGSIVIIYDYETDTFMSEMPETEVTAQPLNEDFKISLMNDILTHSDGRRELLYSEPKKLDSMFR